MKYPLSQLRLLLLALSLPLASAPAAELPPAQDYVTVSPDGHLQKRGERVRYWGVVSNWAFVRPAKGEDSRDPVVRDRLRRDTEAFAQRVADLGFNMVRLWDNIDYTKPYTKGDGSEQDLYAYGLNELDKRGIKVWFSGLNAGPSTYSADDADIIHDPATKEAWQAAVREFAAPVKQPDGTMKARRPAAECNFRFMLAHGWDARTEAIRLRDMKGVADFRNAYKNNLRIADDPQVAVWELANEQYWHTRMFNGHWQKYPAFFRAQLQTRWQEFLKTKYQTDARLTQAWAGLLPEESLARDNILLAPLAQPVASVVLNDVNPEAIKSQTAAKQDFTRDQFSPARASDVIEFIMQLEVAFKTRERDALKSWGRSCQLSPLVFDTGDGYRVHSLYLHQLADAVTMCTYRNGFAQDKSEPNFPWRSAWETSPRTATEVNTPWAEVARVPGKPYFIYETQIANPAKYRSEYPYQMAALGAIQDMDIILWHMFSSPIAVKSETPYERYMEYSNKSFDAGGFHFRFDEVQSSALRAASALFINGSLKPAPNPTVYTLGRDSLYAPESMDYGKSFGELGRTFNATTYAHGTRMSVNLDQKTDTVTGPTLRQEDLTSPLRPTDQIEYSWKAPQQHLRLDAPAGMVYSGFLGQLADPTIRFKNGVQLSNVTLINPPETPYPVSAKETFISFALTAKDGLPLKDSRRITLSLISTSFNTGFALNPEKIAAGDLYSHIKTGADPVLRTRVGGLVTAPALDGMSYRALDWHLKELAKGTVKNGQLTIPANLPIFIVEFTR